MLFSFTAAIGLAACVDSHMLMAKPLPYASQNGNNGPLHADGSNYPCKGDTAYTANGIRNVWPLGSTQELATIGQAVHGGGSCQISITYDKQPNKNSVFKVIHSIVGGCPARNAPGNLGGSASTPGPDTYKFHIPSGLPTGDAVVAWTWFNKFGNPEMYMNCAPVTITGASGKRGAPETDLLVTRGAVFFNSLPDMFKANIGSGCGTAQQGSCVVFPNPGTSVETNTCPFDVNHMFTGNCMAIDGQGTSVAPTSGPNYGSAPTNTGGVFIPAASSTSVVSAPTAPVISSTVQGTSAPAVPSQPAWDENTRESCATANYGQIICSADGMQIGLCDYGGKLVMGPVAAGTKCVNGSMIAVGDAHP